MSIQDIKTFHELCMQEGDEAIAQRLDILLKQKENAEKELEVAKKRLEFLNHKIEKEKTILHHLLPDDKNPSKKKYSKE